MNKRKSIITACLLLISATSMQAQRAYIRNKIANDIEKKVAEPHKERGVNEIDKITYENDKRFKDFKNEQPGTLVFESVQYDKSGNPKTTTRDKYIFGKVGECYVTNLDDKSEMWMIFNYKDKANYTVTKRSNEAIKMPMISAQRAMNNLQNKQSDGTWEKTSETKTISGYPCTKYIYTDKDGSKMDMWVTKNKIMDISKNYFFGARLNTVSPNTSNPNLPNGFPVEMLMYNKKGASTFKRTLVQASNKAEEQYFDLSQFKVVDVIDGLR